MALNFLDGAAILAIIAAIVSGWVAIRKLGPEKDELYITTAQGAAVIQDNLIATLQTEVERARKHNEDCEAKNEALKAKIEAHQDKIGRLETEIERLEAANVALSKRHGTRHEDQSSAD